MSDPEKKNDKTRKVAEIKEMIHGFCVKHLNQELEGYAQKLCDTLGRKRKVDITRGNKEIWAASIIYAIARLNFLFDKENKHYITADTICDFFKAKKSTVGNKATQIEKTCNLGIGAEGYCSKEITDSFTYFKTSEGFILPKSMFVDRESVTDLDDDEEDEEIDNLIDGLLEEMLKAEEKKATERKARSAEINRKIPENKKDKKSPLQLGLFD